MHMWELKMSLKLYIAMPWVFPVSKEEFHNYG